MTGATLELICAAIVVQFVIVRALLDPHPRALVLRLAALAAAAWIGEDTCIHLYGFYAYDPEVWTLWVDVTPLLVPLIWPVVIHSAWDLARHLLRGTRHLRLAPLAAAALVLADASFIEPIAVSAGLWRWFEPGLFAVPPIGVLGWALFALIAFLLLDRGPDPGRRLLGWPALLLVAPLGCHLLLLASWWGALRWVSGPIPSWPAVAAAATLSLTLTSLALARGARLRIPRAEMFARIPAALFFVALLATTARREDPALIALIAWSLAFVPPYLACVDFTHRGAALAAPAGRPA